MSNQFGDFDPNKTGQKFTKTKTRWVVADQSNVYRVLPPFGTLRESNKYAQYWTVHWGFVKSKSGKSIPVACGEETKWENGKKTITKNCPLCDKIKALNNALTAIKNQNNPANQPTILALESKLKSLSTDKKFYMNVLNLEGAVEVLGIGYKQFKELEAKAKILRDTRNFNVAGITNSLFLDFRKSGKGRDTVFPIEPAMISVRDPATGELSEKYRTSNLTPDDLARISAEAKELTTLFRTFTNEDLALIAQGDEGTIKRLFSNPVQDEVDAEEEDSQADQDALNAAAAAALQTAVANSNAAAKSVSAPSTPVQTAAPAATVTPAATKTVDPIVAAQAAMQQPLTTDQILANFLGTTKV